MNSINCLFWFWDAFPVIPVPTAAAPPPDPPKMFPEFEAWFDVTPPNREAWPPPNEFT